MQVLRNFEKHFRVKEVIIQVQGSTKPTDTFASSKIPEILKIDLSKQCV